MAGLTAHFSPYAPIQGMAKLPFMLSWLYVLRKTCIHNTMQALASPCVLTLNDS